MDTRTNSSRAVRRLVGLGGGLLLALAAMVLIQTSAAVPTGTTSVPARSVTTAGTTLTAYGARADDHVSIRWMNLPVGTGGPSADPNIDCSSPTQDGTAVPPCNAASPPQPGAVQAVTDPPPAPIVVVPAPAQAGGFSPGTPPLPSVGTVTAAAGGAPPWTWFGVLAIIDLGLVVGVVIRHRVRQRKRLSAR